MFHTGVLEKIGTQVLYSVTFLKILPFYEIMWKKLCTARQATDKVIPRRRDYELCCRITMARTHTQTQNSTYLLLIFHSNNGYANAHQCYVTRTLLLLFCMLVGNLQFLFLSVMYLSLLSLAYCKVFGTVRSAQTVFMCFVFIWEQTATFATSIINWFVIITELKSVHSVVRTGPLNKAVCASSLTLRPPN
jgi:hypothetical protein